MAEKYCDHGLYGSASVTGHIHASTSTTFSGNAGTYFVVTAVSAGTLSIGSLITGAGVAANTYITGYGTTGRGGIGDYAVNISQATPSTSIGATLGNVSVVPVWGVAQEGDGSTKTASTSATVSIDMTSWTFSISSTVSIMGAPAITCTAAATSTAEVAIPNAQFSATLTTMIDNLVTAINWQGGATGLVTNRPAGWTASKIRNSVFARRNGSSLELMTRAGSASWNTLVAASFSSVTGSSPQSWAGGVGGAWGYISNTAGITLPSSLAANTYGTWAGSTTLLAGVISSGDIVHHRAGKTIPIFTSGIITTPAIGSATARVRMIIGDAAQWPEGAGASLVFQLRVNSNCTITATAASHVSFEAPYNHDTDYYGVYLDGSPNPGSGQLFLAPIGYTAHTGFKVRNSVGGVGAIVSAASGSPSLIGFKVVLGRDVPALQFVRNSACGLFTIDDGVISQGSFASPNSGVFLISNSNSAEAQVRNIKLVGFVTGSKLISNTANGGLKATFENIDLGNVTVWGAYTSQIGIGINPGYDYGAESNALNNWRGDKAFVVDSRKGFVEWNPLRTFPTLNAVLPSGTKWSLRAFPSTVAGVNNTVAPMRLPAVSKYNSLSTAARTFTLQLCVNSSRTPTHATVWVVVQYTAADDSLVTLTSFDIAGGTLTSSTETWIPQNGSSQPVFDDSGIITFNKYEIELSTPVGKNLKIGTEVRVVLCVAYLATAVTDMLFLDPDIGIA